VTLNRRTLLGCSLASLAVAAGSSRAEARAPATDTYPTGNSEWTRPVEVRPDESLFLWPDDAFDIPVGLAEEMLQRSDDPLASDRIEQNIARPRLDIFRSAQPNGAAVIIAPGGGYRYCVVDKEGYELARLLRDRGTTVYILFYRLPADGWSDGKDVPLADAQRAVRLVRSRAEVDGIDPERIVFTGFSAGGHVAASLLTRFDASVYDPVDIADAAPARPDALVAIYPVVSMDPAIAHIGSRDRLIGAKPDAALTALYSPEQNVRKDMPPLFLLHAEDDDVVPVANSMRLHQAARDAGTPVEAHYFEMGGHGFGLMKTAGLPVAIWPELLWNWMGAQKLL
jgi:acetyl esterase/lipase